MKFRRKLAAVLAGIITVTAFSGCSMLGNQTTNALGTYDFTQMDLVQLNKPSEGQDVAVIETNLGTITAVICRIRSQNRGKLQEACRGGIL